MQHLAASVILSILRALYRRRDRTLASLLHDVADEYDPSDLLDERYSRRTPAVEARASGCVLHV